MAPRMGAHGAVVSVVVGSVMRDERAEAGTSGPVLAAFHVRAKRATIAGMSWHHIPKDDAWKQAHLADSAGRARAARS
jgi:hypothetical protein